MTTENGRALLEAKRQVAIEATERLLRTCQFHERSGWLARYVEVLTALRQKMLQEAVFAECRRLQPSGERYPRCEYVVSKDLIEEVRGAIRSLRNELHFADGSPPLVVTTEPLEVGEEATLSASRFGLAVGH